MSRPHKSRGPAAGPLPVGPAKASLQDQPRRQVGVAFRGSPFLRVVADAALGLARDSDSVVPIADILSESKDNTVVAGCCLGLGLLRATGQSRLIREKVLLGTKFKPDTRGYAAIGIALMGDTTQIADLRKVQGGTGLTMETLRQTPLALGVLGGKREVSTLVGHFSRGFKKNERYRASNAVAGLSWDRDVSAVDKLLKAYSGSADRNARGLTVIALGYVGAEEQVDPLTRCYENISFRKRFDWEILLAISGIL